MKATFILKRETKGALLYEEESNGNYIGSLYIRKASPVGEKMPKRIEVEVKEVY